MNTRQILARGLARLFPAMAAEALAEKKARRTAMQMLLDANSKMRIEDISIPQINLSMSCMLKKYEDGNYSDVIKTLRDF